MFRMLIAVALVCLSVIPVDAQTVDECAPDYIVTVLGAYVLSFESTVDSGQSVDKTLSTIQDWITQIRIKCEGMAAEPDYTLAGEKGLYVTDVVEVEDGEYWTNFTSARFASFKLARISGGCAFGSNEITTLDTMPIRLVADGCTLAFTYSALTDWKIELTKVQND